MINLLDKCLLVQMLIQQDIEFVNLMKKHHPNSIFKQDATNEQYRNIKNLLKIIQIQSSSRHQQN